MAIVDILELVGLNRDSEGGLSPLSDSASLVPGPTGRLDAFRLRDELNSSTTNLEWQLIGQDFPARFGLYAVFNASDYQGSIFSISDKSGVLFDVSLWRSSNDTYSFLSVTLPGLGPLVIDIPDSANLADPSSFRSLGVRLFHYQLLVIVDCAVVNFVDLERPPSPLPVGDTTVEVFEEGAVVSGGRGWTMGHAQSGTE